MFFPTRCRWSNLTATFRVNAAMFAITPDAIFKINSYTYIAVATSSTACGLGITCAAWFLLRYNWVELETFIVRTLLTSTSSLHADIVTYCRTVLGTCMVHTSSSLYPHAFPHFACCCPPSPSWSSWDLSHMMHGP